MNSSKVNWQLKQENKPEIFSSVVCTCDNANSPPKIKNKIFYKIIENSLKTIIWKRNAIWLKLLKQYYPKYDRLQTGQK